MKKRICKLSFIFVLIVAFTFVPTSFVKATTVDDTTNETTTASDNNIFGIDISTSGETGGISGALEIVIVLTIIALCPSILIMLTSFTRIIVVLHFTRAALNTNTAPPNQVLVGLALFLTFFVMTPTFTQIYDNAIVPFNNNEITQEEAFEKGLDPLRDFMFKQTGEKDLDSMLQIANVTDIETNDDIPTTVLIPAFIISELRIAFWIGFLIYIPFIIIDMVVASTLMSMGMMMLPPTTISAPFKILLFILADGWNLIIMNLMETFVQ